MKMILPKAFEPAPSIIMGCLLTGKFDVNRQECLPNDDFSLVASWAASITNLGLHAVLFHNHLSAKTCKAHSHKKLTFIKVEHDTRFNANVYRYLVYQKFLHLYGKQLESFFVTDVSDVVLVQNPFIQKLFVENPANLFCGDEPKQLESKWMENHSAHLRSKIASFAAYEAKYKDCPLLNCGIIGGSAQIMTMLLEKIATLHATYNTDNRTAYTGDMAAFNFVVRTEFDGKINHGAPINTLFKGYETQREDCWFRHK